MYQCPNCKANSVSFGQIFLAGWSRNLTRPNCQAALREEVSARYLAILLPFIAWWLMQHYFRNAGFINEVLWLLMATGCGFVIQSLLVVLRAVNTPLPDRPPATES